MRVFTLCAILLATGCQSHQSPQAPPRRTEARITHVVICWLKQPGNAQIRQQLITESKKLRDIPGVVDVSAGTAIPSTRPVVDSSYDLALVFTFRNEQDLNHYLTHPRHQQLLKDHIRPQVDHYKVYDIQDTGP
ncbi:MAG TPA: Dabb family protein [Tepidisphaeraceae bacterium]|jgi:hypothetical protein